MGSKTNPTFLGWASLDNRIFSCIDSRISLTSPCFEPDSEGVCNAKNKVCGIFSWPRVWLFLFSMNLPSSRFTVSTFVRSSQRNKETIWLILLKSLDLPGFEPKSLVIVENLHLFHYRPEFLTGSIHHQHFALRAWIFVNLPIVHRSQAVSLIDTELYIDSSWSSCLC